MLSKIPTFVHSNNSCLPHSVTAVCMHLSEGRMSLWENCEPTNEQLSDLIEIENIIKSSSLTSSQLHSSNAVIPSQQLNLLSSNSSYENFHSKFVTLVEVENKCSSFLLKLDEILMILDDISLSHEEITGRTNVLMMNCESLLEQQVSPSSSPIFILFLITLTAYSE
jgi:hypothetical protein